MKNNITIITDTHFGNSKCADIRGFFMDFLVPYSKKNNSETLVITGDLLDVPLLDGMFFNKEILPVFSELSTIYKEIYIVLGNHDIENVRKTDGSIVMTLGLSPNIKVIGTSGLELKYYTEDSGEERLLWFYPYAIPSALEGYIETQIRARTSDSPIVLFSHLRDEFAGLLNNTSEDEMQSTNNLKGTFVNYGMTVLSGHIHSDITIDCPNIVFLNNPFINSFAEEYDRKVVYTFNLDTLRLDTEDVPLKYSRNFFRLFANSIEELSDISKNTKYLGGYIMLTLNFNMTSSKDELVRSYISRLRAMAANVKILDKETKPDFTSSPENEINQLFDSFNIDLGTDLTKILIDGCRKIGISSLPLDESKNDLEMYLSN